MALCSSVYLSVRQSLCTCAAWRSSACALPAAGSSSAQSLRLLCKNIKSVLGRPGFLPTKQCSLIARPRPRPLARPQRHDSVEEEEEEGLIFPSPLLLFRANLQVEFAQIYADSGIPALLLTHFFKLFSKFSGW